LGIGRKIRLKREKELGKKTGIGRKIRLKREKEMWRKGWGWEERWCNTVDTSHRPSVLFCKVYAVANIYFSPFPIPF
jgi:hypothetical protein